MIRVMRMYAVDVLRTQLYTSCDTSAQYTCWRCASAIYSSKRHVIYYSVLYVAQLSRDVFTAWTTAMKRSRRRLDAGMMERCIEYIQFVVSTSN